MKRAARALCILLLMALFLPAGRMAVAQPESRVRLKIATQDLTTEAPLFIALEKGYFRQEGLDVEFDFVGNGSAIIPMLSTGQLDIGTGSASPALWNAVSRGVPLKVAMPIAMVSPNNRTGFTSAIWFVLSSRLAQSGGVKTFRDLRGKTIAVPGLGLANDIMLDRALQLGGLKRSDVQVKPLPFAEMIPALANGAVDVAVEIEPFVTLGVAKGILARWKNASDVYPGQVVGLVIFGPGFVALGPDIGRRFAIAFTKGARDYNDAFGPKHVGTEQIVEILTKHTTVRDAGLYHSMTWNYINPDCELDVGALARDLSWYTQKNYVENAPDLSRIVDNSYCDAAVRQLGKYSR